MDNHVILTTANGIRQGLIILAESGQSKDISTAIQMIDDATYKIRVATWTGTSVDQIHRAIMWPYLDDDVEKAWGMYERLAELGQVRANLKYQAAAVRTCLTILVSPETGERTRRSVLRHLQAAMMSARPDICQYGLMPEFMWLVYQAPAAPGVEPA